MKIDSLEKEVLRLPPERRARLAELLLSSLEELSESDLERLWLAEAQRCAEQIDSGAAHDPVRRSGSESAVAPAFRYFFHPDAEAEHLVEVAFYEDRRKGLGACYLAKFGEAMRRVCADPRQFRIACEPDLRRAPSTAIALNARRPCPCRR